MVSKLGEINMTLELSDMQHSEFEKHKELVMKVVNSNYGVGFRQTHLLSFDELLQFGYIGLIKGIKNFKEDTAMKYNTFLIQNIHWEIRKGARKYSLRKANKRDTTAEEQQALQVGSLDVVVGEGEDSLPIVETLAADETETYHIDYKGLAEIDKRLPQIIELRLNDYELKEIGNEVGVSESTVSRLLSRNREAILEYITV